MNNNNSETEVGLSKETKRQKTINLKLKKEKIEDKKATQKKKWIEHLNIATINIQGLNVQLKRQLIFKYLNKEGLDIVSVTETIPNKWVLLYIYCSYSRRSGTKKGISNRNGTIGQTLSKALYT